MICDKQKLNIEILKEIIHKHGDHIIFEAETVEEMKQIFIKTIKNKQTIDLVFVCSSFRKEGLFPFLKVLIEGGYNGKIVLTGTIGLNNDLFKEALELNITQYVKKPYEEESVHDILDEGDELFG